MNHMARAISKRYYLPLRWRLAKWAQSYFVEYPHPDVVQDEMFKLRKDLLTARQKDDQIGAALIQGKLDGLRWVLKYGKT